MQLAQNRYSLKKKKFGQGTMHGPGTVVDMPHHVMNADTLKKTEKTMKTRTEEVMRDLRGIGLGLPLGSPRQDALVLYARLLNDLALDAHHLNVP